MNLPIIFPTVFGSIIVLVAADYYVEFRDTAGSSSSSSGAMTTYLYECKGLPPGKPAYTAEGSLCTQVTIPKQKSLIYASCNFHNVRRPIPQGHVMHLFDRGIMVNTDFCLGYLNQAMDHPNFAEPTPGDIHYFKSTIERWVRMGAIPHYLVNDLAVYFAQTNLIVFRENPVAANLKFLGFATLLRKLIELHADINKAPDNTRRSISRRILAGIIRFALQKMIDPCSFLRGNLQSFASQYCATYCTFHTVAAYHFGTTLSGCSSLEGGSCSGVVCTCSRAVNPLQGCQRNQSAVFPMQQCNNAIRPRLN